MKRQKATTTQRKQIESIMNIYLDTDIDMFISSDNQDILLGEMNFSVPKIGILKLERTKIKTTPELEPPRIQDREVLIKGDTFTDSIPQILLFKETIKTDKNNLIKEKYIVYIQEPVPCTFWCLEFFESIEKEIVNLAENIFIFYKKDIKKFFYNSNQDILYEEAEF